MTWTVTYYNKELQDKILELPDTIVAKHLRIVDILLEYGPHIYIPYIKYLGKGLYEMQIFNGGGRSQMFYYWANRSIIQFLHTYSYKKRRGKNKHEMVIVYKRLMEARNGTTII